MSLNLPLKNFKSSIRQSEIKGVSLGGEASLPFMFDENKTLNLPKIAIEILMNIPKNYSKVLRKSWGDLILNMPKWALESEKTACDFLALKFNVDDTKSIEEEVSKSCKLFDEIQKTVKKPLMVIGSLKPDIDKILLPKLAEIANQTCIFGPVEEDSYKEIIPSLVKNNHYVIARTPIDINLAKELNILISDMGMNSDNILIDPNMGALGYGLDYGYSIMERVKLAGLDGDKMLNMQIVAFVGEESWKAKESKSEDFPESWGSLEKRAVIWESITASSVMSAGANLLVCWHKDVVKSLKAFVEE